MQTINPALQQRALIEINNLFRQYIYGSDAVDASELERLWALANKQLTGFIASCSHTAKQIAGEHIIPALTEQEREQEQNFWNLYTTSMHEGLVMQGEALGLAKATAEEIVAAVFGKRAN